MASTAGQRATEKLTFAEAQARVMAAVPRLAARVRIADLPLLDALGLPLAAPFVAPEALPRWDNSAVDGYAVRSSDVSSAPVTLRVTERIGAGHVARSALSSGTAVLLMTGAPIPEGADAVVMREHTREGGDSVVIERAVSARENVRPSGEDVAAGERLFEAGRVIGAGEIGVFASFGLALVSVRQPFRVGLVSTGDELVEPGQPLRPGQLYDSNSFVLRALVRDSFGEVVEVVRAGDEVEMVADAIESLAARCDIVLSIGGVSMGDFDIVKQIALEHDTVRSWRVAMRPGGPQAFGTVGDALFYGLPGNPVSSAVVFDRLLRPAMRAAMGVTPIDRPVIQAQLRDPVTSIAGRRDFLRVELDNQGAARLAGPQSSGSVSSLARAHGLAIIDEAVAALPIDSTVDVILWDNAPGS